MHPEYPPEGIPRSALEQRYGSGFHQRVKEMIEQAGFEYRPPAVVPNSRRALELSELARERGNFAEIHVELFNQHWSKGRDLSDMATLIDIARSAGLSEAEAVEALSDGRYRRRIADSTETAREFGINGIPAWVIDYELLIVGAQPAGVFDKAMERLGYEPLGAS